MKASDLKITLSDESVICAKSVFPTLGIRVLQMVSMNELLYTLSILRGGPMNWIVGKNAAYTLGYYHAAWIFDNLDRVDRVLNKKTDNHEGIRIYHEMLVELMDEVHMRINPMMKKTMEYRRSNGHYAHVYDGLRNVRMKSTEAV